MEILTVSDRINPTLFKFSYLCRHGKQREETVPFGRIRIDLQGFLCLEQEPTPQLEGRQHLGGDGLSELTLRDSEERETLPYRRGLRCGRHCATAGRVQRLQGQPREDARRPPRGHTLYY